MGLTYFIIIRMPPSPPPLPALNFLDQPVLSMHVRKSIRFSLSSYAHAPPLPTHIHTQLFPNPVMLSLVDQGNDPLCVGDSVVFNCSMSPSRFQGITTFSWRVTHPNLDTVHLSLGGGVDTLAVEELGGAIFAWTSKYETDRYFESYLTITHQTNISIGLYNVECILHGYGSATASAATNNTFFGTSLLIIVRFLSHTELEPALLMCYCH